MNKKVILYVKEPLPINPATGNYYPSDQAYIDELLNNYGIEVANSHTELTAKLQ
ncbi:MAG: hypothetical protein DHS20C18_24840 [Saprospiraceae bacterium]|nr:MAG: hypothetical protein DHS20C18_24840 [Saprospiraceae bacterium]